MLPTPTGSGYWLVASDGGVFAFGDAGFLGSLGANPPASPIVALAPTPTGAGYWLVSADGTVYAFGDAVHRGDAPGTTAVDIAALPAGGYVVLAADGTTRAFGPGASGLSSSPVSGRLAGPFGDRAVGIAVRPDGRGTWTAWSGTARDRRIDTAQGPHDAIRSAWPSCPAPLRWYLDPHAAPAGAGEMAAEVFAYVGRITGVPTEYGGELASGDDLPGGNVVVIAFEPSFSDAGILGLGGPLDDTSGLVLLNVDAIEELARWYGGGAGGDRVWLSVTTHEVGHALGLGHVDDPGQLMYPTFGKLDGFGDGDLAGLRDLGVRCN
jgi:hypothetical protein